jgi:hypothetical protein
LVYLFVQRRTRQITLTLLVWDYLNRYIEKNFGINFAIKISDEDTIPLEKARRI